MFADKRRRCGEGRTRRGERDLRGKNQAAFFRPPPGVEQDFFTGNFDAEAEILVGFQVGDDHGRRSGGR